MSAKASPHSPSSPTMKAPLRLRGVLFDMDGVLVDSVRAWHRTIDQGAQRRGLPGVSWERFSGTFGQGVDADQRDFFPGLSAREVFALYNDEFPEHLDAVELMPGALELLDSLAARGLGAAVVTNTPRPLAERVLAHTGIAARVQGLAAGGDGPEKPSPELVNHALRQLDLGPEEVLYVGDSASDAGATAAAGVRFVGRGYTPAPQRVETLQELEPLLDIAGALPAAPPSAVDETGAPRFGCYRGAMVDTSFESLSTATLGTWGRLRRGLGQKRWSYLGIYGERFIAAACVVDLTYLSSCFAFAYDRQSERLVEHHLIGPRLLPLVSDSPCSGRARFWDPRGKLELRADGLRRHLDCKLGRGERRLELEAWCDEESDAGLSLLTRQGRGNLGYTFKNADLPLRCVLRLGGEEHVLEDHRAVVDYTHGIPPRDTHWLWASACGSLVDGASFGLNCVNGWNEAPGPGGENAAWIDGELRPLGPVSFDRPGEDLWLLRSPELAIDFRREAQREQHVDLGLLASIYTQPLGSFTGWLLDAEGRKRELSAVAGVTEDHRARW